jgi:alpha-L-rhamnosidase
LVQDIGVTRDGHLNTGIIGTRFFFHTLSKYGYSELAYKVLTQTSYPGYGYMIKEGATTLWERWEYLTGAAMNSHNHIMFGSFDGWLYDTIGGIYPDSPGFRHFTIRPFVPEKMDFASTSLQTVSGLIVANWKKINVREESGIEMEVTVPANSSATVCIPRNGRDSGVLFEGEGKLFEGGKIVLELPNGIFRVLAMKDYFECEIGSGSYHFKVGN